MSAGRIHDVYRRSLATKIVFISILGCCALLFSIIGCGIGPIKYSIPDIIKALVNGLFGSTFNVSDGTVAVITQIRLPRIALALLSGCGLAVSGMQLQVILRNPLASPLTLGVSSGAALGAGIAILTGYSFLGGRYMVIANAFICSLIPCAVVFLMSRIGVTSYSMIILAGIAMNFIFSSVLTLLKYFTTGEELRSLTLWLMGNLGRATWSDIAIVFSVFIVTLPILFLQNQKLNVLNSGDESATGLGVNVVRTRITVLVVTAMMSASIICFTGIIGFVGLVAPHIVRLVIGNDARFLMPASGLFGAVFLLVADMVAIRIIEPTVLPVGIITSFAGGPSLLWLIIRKQKERVW